METFAKILTSPFVTNLAADMLRWYIDQKAPVNVLPDVRVAFHRWGLREIKEAHDLLWYAGLIEKPNGPCGGNAVSERGIEFAIANLADL